MMAHCISDWKDKNGILFRYNGNFDGWQAKVNGQISKKVFADADAAIIFGEKQKQLDDSKEEVVE